MKFIIANYKFVGSNMLENELDQNIFKELAFSSKICMKTPSKHFEMEYNHVLIPVLEGTILEKNDFTSFLNNSIERPIFELTNNDRQSLIATLLLSDLLTKTFFNYKISILPIKVVDADELGVSYSDGSFRKSTNEAAYACFKLLKESEDGVLDDFLGKKFTYSKQSGKTKDGTNNIGELKGIETIIGSMLPEDHRFQVVISDSEYGLKCIREWYYNWKANGFKTYSKKPIANKDLICSIFDKISDFQKMIFFKWVKGHNKNSFNELCDIEAKAALDI